ncbi:MAG: tRNA 2-thiouridine(34) synthase MnmA [Alphaproteobacteria bacterium]|nr:tRNA 2-thiouridine(34) synthase MnmA [Alphaproteobacteria bacterium]
MKILVGMSGGVDSSAAALILKEAGHDVIGATMTIWDNSETFKKLTSKGCFSSHEEDIAQAKKVCQSLSIPHFVIDCTEEFKKTVIENFRSEYLSGRTPNPCVVCNQKIKFSVLPQVAKQKGIDFDKFATGHYARLHQNPNNKMFQILRGVDNKKDQSYFLYRLSQEQLSQIILPLGNMEKSQIRELAKKAGLDVSEKPDSQDFYTGDLNDILQFPPKQGNFINKDGKILGHHQGYWKYTIGQRRGLGISADRPLYIININKEINEITLGYAEDCIQTKLIASDFVWQIPAPAKPFKCQARIRSSQQPCDVEVTPINEHDFEVTFLSPQSAITTGQSVVLNDECLILGGGIIEKVL